MRFDTKMNYTAYYKLPKKGSWHSATMLTDYSFELETVDRAQAELAFVVGEAPDYSTYTDSNGLEKMSALSVSNNLAHPFRSIEGRPIEVLSIDGVFFAERTTVEGFKAWLSSKPLSVEEEEELGLVEPNANSPLTGTLKRKAPEEAPSNDHWRVGFRDADAAVTIDDVIRKLAEEAQKRAEEARERARGTWAYGGRETQVEATPTELKKWTSYEADYRKLLDEVVSNYRIVDGSVFERVAEPMLVLTEDHNAIYLTLDETRRPFSRPKELIRHTIPGRTLYFGIDEMDRAIEFGKKWAGEKVIFFHNRTDVRVTTPWNVSFRGDSKALYDAARHAHRVLCTGIDPHGSSTSSGSDVFKALKREEGLAAHDLGVALEGTSGTTPALHRAATRFVAVAEAAAAKAVKDKIVDPHARKLWNEHQEEKLSHRLADVCQSLKKALQVYNSKEDDGLDWNRLALDASPMFEGRYRYYEATNRYEVSLIEEKIGASLSSPAEDAAKERGRLMIVEDFVDNITVGAVYVSHQYDPAAPVISWTKSGRPIDEMHIKTIEAFLDKSATNDHALAAELAELGF